MKGYPGVSAFTVRYKKRRGPRRNRTIVYTYYKARIMVDGKAKFLGHYPTAKQAALVYAEAQRRGQ